MVISKRGRRRLIVIFSIIAVVVGAVFTFNIVKGQQKERLFAEARERGLAAYERGDFATALEGDHLPFVIQYDKNDVDVVMAFADARAQQPLPGGRHIRESIDYNEHVRKLIEGQTARPDRRELLTEINQRLLSLYLSAGLRHEASTTAERLLKQDEDNIEAMATVASVALFDRKFDVAVPMVERLMAAEPEVMSWRELDLEIARTRGDTMPEIIARCEQWAEEFEGDARFDILLGFTLVREGRWDDANELVPDIINRGVEDSNTLEGALALFDQLGRREEARTLIEQTIAATPDDLWVRLAYVRRLWQSNRPQEALDVLPDEPDVNDVEHLAQWRRLRSLVLIAVGSTQPAIAHLTEMRERAPLNDDRQWADAMLARFELTPATFKVTRKRIEAALALRPGDPTLHFILGEAYSIVGEHSRAMEAFGDSFRRDPNWLAPGYAYIQQALDANRVFDAYAFAREVLRRAPRDQAEPYVMFARAHLALRRAGGNPQITETVSGRSVTLHDMLRQILAQAPEHPDLVPLEVEALILDGRERDVTDRMARIMNSRTAPVPTRLRLAELCRIYGRAEERQLIQSAVTNAPGNIDASFALARWLRDHDDAGAGRGVIETLESGLDVDDRQSIDVMQRTAAYLVSINADDANQQLEALLDEHPYAVSAARLTLQAPCAWRDQPLITRAIGQLSSLLGDYDPAVRLAEARRLVYYESAEEPKLARALTLISGVLESEPNTLDALMLMADASLRGRNPSIGRAVEHLERAVALYPTRTDLTARLVGLLQSQGSFDRAALYLNQLAGVAGDRSNLRSVELSLLQTQGNFDLAMDRARELIGDDASLTDRLAYASICMRAGDYAKAEAIYTKLRSEQPTDPMVLRAVSDFYAMTGRLEEGAALVRTLDVDDAERHAALGLFFQRHHRDDLAEPELRQALERAPDRVEVRAALAFAAARQGKTDEARTHAMEGLKREPEHTALRTVIAMVGLGADSAQRARSLATLRNVLESDEPLLEVLALLADVPVVDGEDKPERTHLTRAVKLTERFGGYLPAWQLAVFLHADAGQRDEAIAMARRAVARFPSRPEPCEWAARLLADHRQWGESLSEAQEWRRRRIDDLLSIDVFIAGLLLELNRPVDARAQLARYEKQIRAEADRRPRHLAMWVNALVSSGEVSRAWTLIGDRLDDETSWRQGWISLANRVDSKSARDVLERITPAIGNRPDDRLTLAAAWNALGRRLNMTEVYAHAEQIVMPLVNDPKWSTEAMLILGSVAEGRGDVEEAIEKYRAVTERQPTNMLAMNNLAALLSTQPAHATEALRLAERVARAMPNNADVEDTLAAALMAAGKNDAALRHLETAISLRPDDPSIRLREVRALLALGRHERAGTRLSAVGSLLERQPAANELHRLDYAELRREIQQASARARDDL
jgi:tetratricopeptide (TPR) repeat protein